MKKKMLAGVLALAMAPMMAHAEKGPGCGLGSMLFDGQAGIAPNVLAATTNGSFGNQTFGMTSGTLGCDGNGTVTFAAAGEYLDANMDKVARSMATGQGEAIDTLASLMGISDADKATFVQVSKENFSSIFSSEEVTSDEVMASIESLMSSNDKLSKYVS